MLIIPEGTPVGGWFHPNGVDVGPRGAQLIKLQGHVAVVRVPGHRYWAQHGPGDTHAYARQQILIVDTSQHKVLVSYEGTVTTPKTEVG